MTISTYKVTVVQGGWSLIHGYSLQSPWMGQQCHLILTSSSSYQRWSAGILQTRTISHGGQKTSLHELNEPHSHGIHVGKKYSIKILPHECVRLLPRERGALVNRQYCCLVLSNPKSTSWTQVSTLSRRFQFCLVS